jgi:hypothetical protein
MSMRPRGSPRPRYSDVKKHLATRAFWGGVAGGMRSPAGRDGFGKAYRRTVWPAAIGSFGLLQWARHSRSRAGLPALSHSQELEMCMIGALAATALVVVVLWAWRRLRPS